MTSSAFVTGFVLGAAAGAGLAYRRYAWLPGRWKVRAKTRTQTAVTVYYASTINSELPESFQQEANATYQRNTPAPVPEATDNSSKASDQ